MKISQAGDTGIPLTCLRCRSRPKFTQRNVRTIVKNYASVTGACYSSMHLVTDDMYKSCKSSNPETIDFESLHVRTRRRTPSTRRRAVRIASIFVASLLSLTCTRKFLVLTLFALFWTAVGIGESVLPLFPFGLQEFSFNFCVSSCVLGNFRSSRHLKCT